MGTDINLNISEIRTGVNISNSLFEAILRLHKKICK